VEVWIKRETELLDFPTCHARIFEIFGVEGIVENVKHGDFAAKLDERKRVSRNGIEFWMARDIQPILAYGEWRHFEEVIQKARLASESTGADPDHHFVATDKLVPIGSGAERTRRDWYLSRYAAYLIAMNGNPAKAEVGFAQTYFAVQTRRQEKRDYVLDVEKRIALRRRVANANLQLTSVAKRAGVQRYALFHAAGYKSLYGMPLPEIKRRKGLRENEDLLDRAGRSELAANEFRITQTEEKIVRESILGEQAAIAAHQTVAAEVRSTISRLGGTMPENLPPEPSLKKILANRSKRLPPPT
jgi:DNA-damage-inducible protein D